MMKIKDVIIATFENCNTISEADISKISVNMYRYHALLNKI